ncbi:Subtilisin-like serine protease [Sandaracinus amylolyticus]|uniref:Subtilisin-like serine protease n=1 Tax=Sandaracinus amylolyticus TaxID=927083 RepID=A0A0F6YKC2_9BACT|nr:Subtilisin-like serine protease [Sandaracinus amylolyticus]
MRLALLVALVGCGDDDGVSPGVDASMPRVDAHVPPVDAGADGGRDLEPPVVTSTRPRAGETEVAGGRAVEIRWSEAIAEGGGTVRATSEGTTIALEAPTWSPERDVLLVAPTEGWPSSSRVVVTVEGFTDVAGNAQTDAFELTFETSDAGPPSVVSTTPTEGAIDVARDLDAIVVRFSEPMNPYLGTLALSGGPGALGARSWAGEDELHVAVSGLAWGTTYHIALDGFADVEGNALAASAVLVDGALDFATVADTTAPRVVDSNPTNEQLDLDVVALESIRITFDESMDVSRRTASLAVGEGAPTTLTGNWSADGTVLTFAATGRVSAQAVHRVDLSAMRDAAGNALVLDVNLSEGELVFTTSPTDEAIPFVVFASPAEGATDVPTRAMGIEVLFSEAMDTTTTQLDLVGGGTTRALAGTWNAAGTRLLLAIPDGIGSNAPHALDLRALRDASGNALDPAHPYLGDGVLDFTTGTPTGEDCSDPLTTAVATRDGDAWVWTIAPAAFGAQDGAPTCGTTATSRHRDGVIEIVKTTPDIASGGRALRIEVVSATSLNGVQFEVLRGACDPALATGATGTREICAPARLRSVQYLDVPAGNYYLWLAERRGQVTEGTSPPMTFQVAFPGATVRVEEVAALPEGESCGSPYTSTSSNHSAPGVDSHQWTVAFDALRSMEYGASGVGEDALSCVSAQGADGVVRVDKARESSFLDVTVEPFPREDGGIYVEARAACDASSGDALQCTRRIQSRDSFQVQASAGPVWLWLASYVPTSANTEPFPRVTIRTREVDAAPGETCATAIPITPDATVPITPSTTTRYFAPSCITSGPVTYYRYTTTRELDLVGTVGTAPMALIDRTSGAELGCWDDASVVPMPRRAPAGSEVCIAVPSGASITALTVRELDWTGIDGDATVIPVTRPEGVTLTSEAWLALSPTQLHLGITPDSTTTAGFVTFPRAGGAGTFVPVTRYSIGNAAVTVGDALYSVDETNLAARPSRLFRLITSMGGLDTPNGTAWDPGSSYGTGDIDAMGMIAGTDTVIMANEGTTTLPTSFFTASLTTAGGAIRIGMNSGIRDATAIAANADWVFVIGTTGLGRGVYRLPRATLATATPQPLTPPGEVSFNTTNGSMVYDAARDVLYVRTNGSIATVDAIFGASTATPAYAGPVVVRGRSTDHGLALDPTVPALFLFETVTDAAGSLVEIR